MKNLSIFLILLVTVSSKPQGKKSTDWKVFPYGSRRIGIWGGREVEYVGHHSTVYPISIAGRIICAMNSSATPKNLEWYQEITYPVSPSKEILMNYVDNDTTQSFVMGEKKYGESQRCGPSCDLFYFFLTFQGVRQCTPSAIHDSTLTNRLSLDFEQMTVRSYTILDVFVVMDMGIYDYSKKEKGTHEIPSLAIGGKVTCSHNNKESKSQDLLIVLRQRERIVSEAVTNKEGIFYMQIYDERFDHDAIYNKRLNLWIEHSCTPHEDTDTETLIIQLKMDKIQGRKQFYPNYHTILRAADFAVCPTFWFENLELGKDLPTDED